MRFPQRLGKPGLALLIGLGSAFIAFQINMPLPWMLGSMIGVTIAAMSGAPILAPARLRPIVIPVIGVMLGSGITAELFAQLGQWARTLAILPLVLIATAGTSFLIYRRIGSYDPVTAFYSSMPGGLNEMLVIGGAAGGDERRIALAHAARVLMIIFLVALVFGIFFGIQSGAGNGNWTPLTAPTLRDYALLLGCAAVGAPLAKIIRLPAPGLFGPMILSGLVHITGWTHIAPPSVFIIGAQVVVGTIIGCRFIGATLHEVGKDLVLACVITVISLLATAFFAWIVAHLLGMSIGQAFLAFAPGGVTEMSLMTLAIGQDVAFVSVAHLIRITLVIAIAPILFNFFLRLSGLAKPPNSD